jgi:hypothetical protein
MIIRKCDLWMNDLYWIRIAPVRNESSQGLVALITDNIYVSRSESRSIVNILSTVIRADWCLPIQGQKIDLTAKEFDALRLLIEN